MKRLIISSTAILLFAVNSLAQLNDSRDKCTGLEEKVLTLISQYKELRDRRSHLPQGKFDHDLHHDKGKLHTVLSSLGVELGHPPHTKQTIIACLGEPDWLRNTEQMGRFLDIYHKELKKAGRKVEEKANREYLVYFWRGGHDFLFFISEDGIIADHGWWFAYE